jgi:D-alanyl-D-alanine carboxypeptidase/D-alanyl-D-alanine-endopeptidase (penicillin-binding protein 4)
MQASLTFVLAFLGLMIAEGAAAADPGTLAAAARSILGADQGVYVEAADGTVLLSQLASKPVHPASVSKVPTTLALLKKFGPEHRFLTLFATRGRLIDGTLHGDLLVEADGNPALVDEDALLITQRLRAIGIERIAGTVRPLGSLIFDWQSDPDGVRLGAALSGQVSGSAWQAVQSLASSPPPVNSAATPAIEFVSAAAPAALSATRATAAHDGEVPSEPEHALVLHRSEPLLFLAKALNDFSNNIFKPLADAAGGAAAVERVARDTVPKAMRSEITLGDGAGTDPRNRLSPRAAVKLLRALEVELAASRHGLIDILPVTGIDDGTLHNRLNDAEAIGRVVGKTGTFGDYGASALVGAFPSSDRGTVYFAILNHGVPVPEARRRQDALVRVLLARLQSRSWNYQRDPRPAIARVQVELP